MSIENTSRTRLSINHATLRTTPLPRFLDVLTEHGITCAGLWRHSLDIGSAAAAHLLRSSGVQVSSYTSGDFAVAPAGSVQQARDLLHRALDEAAEIGAPRLVVRAGGLRDGSRDIHSARAGVGEALAAASPHATATGVRILLEPLHPLFVADRGVVVTLAQALAMVSDLDPSAVGVALDLYNSWWDPFLEADIGHGAERIHLVQVADWVAPYTPDPVLSRQLPGDGLIDFGPPLHALKAVDYSGPLEIEVFNETLWRRAPEDVMTLISTRIRNLISPLA